MMAHSQVLAAAAVFSAQLSAAAWKSKPCWGIVAGNDQIINPDLERWYYARANADIAEVPGASHAVYESRAREAAGVIADAARSLDDPPSRTSW